MRLLTIALVALAACAPDGDPANADPCDEPGAICTFLGVPGEAMFAPEGQHRLESHLYLPVDIHFGADNTAYFPDFNNHRVRRIDADGVVTTVTGTGMLGDGPIGTSGCFAPASCDAAASAWNHPTDLIVDPVNPDTLYIAAWHNSRINVVDTTARSMTWFAGTGGRQFGGDDGPAPEAVLDLPSSIVMDERDGALYVSDQANHVIRRIDPDGTITTVAGQPRNAGFSGDGGPALDAQLHGHTAQAADPGSKLALHDGILYITDTVNGVIRALDLDTGVIDTFAGKYTSAGVDEHVNDAGEVSVHDRGSIPGYAGDGGLASEAVFFTPRDVAVGIDGEVYIADTKNHCVRVVDPTTGRIDTFAGACGTSGFAGDEGPAADALLAEPFGVAVDRDGHVYVADTLNHVIRRVAR